jgi:hypothetical protein
MPRVASPILTEGTALDFCCYWSIRSRVAGALAFGQAEDKTIRGTTHSKADV